MRARKLIFWHSSGRDQRDPPPTVVKLPKQARGSEIMKEIAFEVNRRKYVSNTQMQYCNKDYFHSRLININQ